MSSTPDPVSYHITLLRHGESVGNSEGRLQGQADFPLTDTGRQQARALTERWLVEGRSFDYVISSPLIRARETAEIIAAGLSLPVELDQLWVERNYGVLSGLTIEAAVQTAGRHLYARPYEPVGETGEGPWELYLRGCQAVHDLLRRPAGRYLVVSHGGILNMVLYAMLGITPQAELRGARFLFLNTAYTTLTYTPSDYLWRVLGLNERSHWVGDD